MTAAVSQSVIWVRIRDTQGTDHVLGTVEDNKSSGWERREEFSCLNTHHAMALGLRAREWTQSVWFNNVS